MTTGGSNISQGYYAYGRFRSGGPLPTDQSFTGQKFDSTGLFYYNSRYYDPQLGIFLSPDTLVPDPATLFDYNRYMYVRGNPLRYNDPTGHCAVCVVLVLAAVAIGVEGSVAPGPAGGYVDTPPNANGRLAVSLLAGDANDLAIVTTGYDYIHQEEVPFLSEGYVNALGAAALPLISHSTVKIADEIVEGATDAAKSVDNTPREVAFGFSRFLPGFKRVVPQAQNYMDMGLNPYASDFADNISNAMNNAERIHFDISFMRGLNGEDGVLTGATRYNRGSTNWELRTIWDSPELMAKTTFYRYGKEISVGEILQLQD